MAQGRSNQIELKEEQGDALDNESLLPLPEPTQKEPISQIEEYLANSAKYFERMRRDLEGLELVILSKMKANYEAPQVLPEGSIKETLYEMVAPYFVPAHHFLKHILDKNKEDTKNVKKNLLDLLQLSHAEFDKLAEIEKFNYLLNICVISVAILQDLHLLINKYEEEIERCLDFQETKETAVNSFTTILLDIKLYQPDVDHKRIAEYRRQLYSEINVVDNSMHGFFVEMHGCIETAMDFVKNYQQHLNPEALKKSQAPAAGTLANAIGQTLLAPPLAAQAEPVAEQQSSKRSCTIL